MPTATITNQEWKITTRHERVQKPHCCGGLQCSARHTCVERCFVHFSRVSLQILCRPECHHSQCESLNDAYRYGHALHSVLSRTKYQHLSGTRGPLDAVEVPSHILEKFLTDERVVDAILPKRPVEELMVVDPEIRTVMDRQPIMAQECRLTGTGHVSIETHIPDAPTCEPRSATSLVRCVFVAC